MFLFLLICLVTDFWFVWQNRNKVLSWAAINTFCYFSLYFLFRNLAHGTCQLRSRRQKTTIRTLGWFIGTLLIKYLMTFVRTWSYAVRKKIYLKWKVQMSTEHVGVFNACACTTLHHWASSCSPVCVCECEIVGSGDKAVYVKCH